MKRSILVGILFLSALGVPAFETATPHALTPDPSPGGRGEQDFAARFKVPPGFVVELVATPPLVDHPMMANFDERGRLFVAESSGLNLKADELLKQLPNKVLLLEDVDAKGRFTKSRVFADKMTFPSGALPYNGSVYVTAAPHIWKLRDTKNVGVADERTELVSKFNFIGNAADLHGPFLGPDGRIYWCDGRHGHEIKKPDGSVSKGKAARIFRCKPDGSDVEVVCGGGMDNPVEIAFTDEGEPLVTVDILHNMPSRNDGIIFAIEGGNYPWHEVSKEFQRTGDLLPAIENLGWVAPSGIMRYRSLAFGPKYQGSFFTAQFNRHRIQSHILERKGAGFVCKTEDFLTSDDKNFHPTDAVEDADGSILVVDTGGWFRIGCPTSQTAKPEFKGAIYRIRRAGLIPLDDPRLLSLRWDVSAKGLSRLRVFPTFPVRDRLIQEFSNRGKESLPYLESMLKSSLQRERLDAVWSLTRIELDEARARVRPMVNDKDLSVKLAALHSVGLYRDAKALPDLLKIVAKDHPAAQRNAATALGRIKNASAIEPIMTAMATSNGDRFLEHALIYALIQINDQDKTAPFLKHADSAVRRAALIACDQMDASKLTREDLAHQLRTGDKAILKTAIDIVASRPKWAGEIAEPLRDWLITRDSKAFPADNLRALLQATCKEPAIQKLMVEALEHAETTPAVQVVLLETFAAAPLAKLPPAWLEVLDKTLDHADDRLVLQSIGAMRARSLTQFDKKLDRLLLNSKRSPETRVQAFSALAPRTNRVGADAFLFLLIELKDDRPPLRRLAVAKGLAQVSLDEEQLTVLTDTIAFAGPLELPALLSAFEKNKSADVGKALLKSLEKSKSLASLTPMAIDKAFAHCSEDLRKQTAKLTERLKVDAAKQNARLDELESLAKGGSIEQGRDIYFGNKASCSACHAINNKGGGVGPDLGKIGAIRSGRDLLESIVFPSASFARGFEPYMVETKAGKTHAGILARESSEAIYLLTTERVEIRIARDEIEALVPGRVSIMPQGLETGLTRRELQDLLAYLQSLR